MKKSSVGSIALFVIFTISGIYCDSPDSNSKCTENYQKCLESSDCCSKKCFMSGFIKNRFCMHPNSTLKDYNRIDPIKIQKGMCSYYKPKNEQVNKNMLNSFGLFASHPLLPINSMVKVEHNDSTVIVMISSQHSENKNNSILELSREAAKALGIEKEGLVDCSLQLLPSYENYYPLLKPIGIIVFYIVAIFLIV